ncbi:PstS family phosphate ABC transporter substrate-binding protein [Nitrospira sp. BLG_1]|uniref:PstS family phosphate ABC transporter substrate-binding protein n=1 Tax=Nitrospira sp. BLG_1 TaxID=3395883 RepID=UPI0039BC5DEC
MHQSRKIFALGCTLLAAFHLVSFVEHASAEHSDPLTTLNVSSGLAHYESKSHVSGGFKVQCSEALYPLLTRIAIDFQKFQPKMHIDVRKGSSKAVAEFLQPPLHKTGKIRMIDDRASSFQLLATTHQLSETEVKEFIAQHGYQPTIVPVAVDAVALYVHKENPLVGLTLDQVDALFSSTRKRGATASISQWGQLGLADGWKEAAIQLHGRDHQSEARATIQEQGLGGGDFNGNVREHPGAASVALTIDRTPTGIGYSGLGLYTSNVRAVPIAEKTGVPFVMPTPETVADHTYPLQQVLHLYIDKLPKASLPDTVKEFLAFLMSHEGEATILKAGLFPLSPTQSESRAVALGISTGNVQSRNPPNVQ